MAWDPETRDPALDVCLGNSPGFNVLDRDGLWPACETVDHREEVPVASGLRKGPYQVYMDMVESPCGGRESLEWSFDMGLDFRPLAV